MNKLNKKNINKILFLLLIFNILFISVSFADEISKTSISNEIDENNIKINSEAAILIDASSGQILFEYNARERLYPASTTKLLTAILTLENCKLDDIVTVNPKALNGIPRTYTTAALRANEQLTVEQLLHVLLIPSANDAANVLAFHISGSIEEFSKLMNKKATEIGCVDSNFLNPSGIHNDNHYSNAYDMALIGKYANNFETIKNIATITTYALPDTPDGKPRSFKTTNTLITPNHKYFYEYATGLKTGYTDKAKSCIVSKAKKDDIELICVVLGGNKTSDGQSERELDCHTLFDYGFSNFKYYDICTKQGFIDLNTIEVPQNLKNTNLTYSDDLKVLANKDTIDLTNPSVTWNDNLNLPIYKNTIVGTINYKINNSSYSINLIANEDILPISNKSMNNIFYILVFVFILLLMFFILSNKRRHKYHKKSKSSRDKEPKYFKHSFY